MTMKPQHIGGYNAQQTRLVRATCLDLATRLGDLMSDLVIVGGMVPGLLVPQDNLPPGADAHCGTADIDLGLSVALFDDQRYQDLTDRLGAAGFEPDKNKEGNLTRQRWRVVDDNSLTIDFLVAPSSTDEQKRQGKLRNIEKDLAAIISPGLHLAFEDIQSIELAGTTRTGEHTACCLSVSGPAAFVALKALAFGTRGENKDAYDLFYVLRNFGTGLDEIVTHFKPLLGDDQTNKALSIIEQNFTRENHTGPMRASRFIHNVVDDATCADVVGLARGLLNKLESNA